MGWVLGPALVASLLEVAALDADVGLRAETRSSTLAAPGLPSTTRTSISATPSATGIAEGSGLRLTATYAPRFWTSDVEARASQLVNHAVEARLATHHDAPWRLAATAEAIRGSIDPLSDALRAQAFAGEGGQVPTTQPLRYEALRTGLGGELRLDARTTLAVTAGWHVSRALGLDAAALPPQQGASLDGSFTRSMTERDSLRLAARSAGTMTGDAAARTRTASTTAGGTWRRRLTPRLDGWLGGAPSWCTRTRSRRAGGSRCGPRARSASRGAVTTWRSGSCSCPARPPSSIASRER